MGRPPKDIDEDGTQMRRERNRRYRESHREKINEIQRAYAKTPVGKIRVKLAQTRYLLRRNPTDALRKTETTLLAELAMFTRSR